MSIEQQAKAKIENQHKVLSDSGYTVNPVEKKNYNYEFLVTSGREKLKVQVYFGKKGIKQQLQGSSSTILYQAVSELINEEPKFELQGNEIEEPDEYIGSDETGKGDFFGPLVVCAAFINSAQKKQLLSIGVRDSKALNDMQINKLAKDVRTILKDSYETIKINPEKYNDLYSSFKNLNKMLDWAHSKAIENLLNKSGANTIITDKFMNKPLSVSRTKAGAGFYQYTKGERYTAVAAASIIARADFNYWFYKQSQEFMTLPKGSSSPDVVATAQQIATRFGKNKLKEFCKLHFKSIEKIT